MTDDLRSFIEDVIAAAANVCGIPREMMSVHTRKKEVVMARFLAYKIIHDKTRHIDTPDGRRALPSWKIGRIMGNFTHCAVLHGIKTANLALGNDPRIKAITEWMAAYDAIMAKIVNTFELDMISGGQFFPYNNEGHIKAREFLYDMGEFGLRDGRRNRVILAANKLINKYKVSNVEN